VSANGDENGERHSVAPSDEIITDPDEKARKEVANALLQVDLVNSMIDEGCDPERQPFRLRPSWIIRLHRQALEGLSHFAGTYRPGPVEIGKSKHQPPEAFLVAELVQEMCDYVNSHWDDRTALHVASYVLWKVNWIHPFTDGNGRTARAVSHLVLCVHLKMKLPGTNTVPEQIAQNKTPYYSALEASDEAAKEGRTDIAMMENYLGDLLANQLAGILEAATGRQLSASGA
jgi:Fic family protein